VTEREIAESIRTHAPGSAVMIDRSEDPAYAELFRLLRSHFLAFLSFGTSPGSGEDLLQELYTLMLDAIERDRVDQPDALVSYARGVARNLRAGAIEKQTERLRRVVDIRPAFKSCERELIDRDDAAEMSGIIHAVIAGLSAQDRELIDRFFFRGQRHAAIREAMHLSPGQLHSRMDRVRQRLKRGYERTMRLSPGDDRGPA